MLFEPVAIFVLPTEENVPPRAVIGTPVTTENGEGIQGSLVTWSADMGTWIFPSGMPVPPEIAEATTEHAKDLGVEW